MSRAEWDESALDSTIKATLRDVRKMENLDAAMRRLHGLSRLVRERGETADRRALIVQAYQEVWKRADGTPTAAELASWAAS